MRSLTFALFDGGFQTNEDGCQIGSGRVMRWFFDPALLDIG